MIYGRISEAKDYYGIHPLLDEALNHMQDPDFMNQVCDHTQHIQGDELYVTRYTYETVPQSEAFFESHRQYLDIQIMVEGREKVGIACPETLEEYEHRGDLWLYHGEPEQTLTIEPGHFLVVFPGDAHELKVCTDKPRQVSKVVFKIKVHD